MKDNMSDEAPKADGEYEGVAFYVNEYWKFEVPDLNRNFDSYEKMCAAITASAKQVVAAKRRKLNLAGVDAKGRKYIVTGVHSGHGKLLTSPAQERFGGREIYADTPLVAQALAEKRRLDCDLARVNKLLDAHRFRPFDGYSFTPSQHESAVAKIERIQERAEKFANKPLMEVLAGIKAKPVEFD